MAPKSPKAAPPASAAEIYAAFANLKIVDFAFIDQKTNETAVHKAKNRPVVTELGDQGYYRRQELKDKKAEFIVSSQYYLQKPVRASLADIDYKTAKETTIAGEHFIRMTIQGYYESYNIHIKGDLQTVSQALQAYAESHDTYLDMTDGLEEWITTVNAKTKSAHAEKTRAACDKITDFVAARAAARAANPGKLRVLARQFAHHARKILPARVQKPLSAAKSASPPVG